MKAPGRIHQDDNFDVKGFEGEIIEELFGIADKNDSDNKPILIYIKVTNLTWQQYFLDAILAFWEDWGVIEFDEDYDKLVDYGEIFKLKGQAVKEIKCRNCKISIVLANGDQFILQHIYSNDENSDCEVIFKQSNT